MLDINETNTTSKIKKIKTNHNTDGLINYLIPIRGISMSSDRMNFLSCFANQIVVGPRLPFATRTISQSALNVYAIKFISTYQVLLHPDCSCCQDKVNRAAGRRSGALFFARHLDYYIVTQNFSATYQDWQKTRHLDADANSLNRRAVGGNPSETRADIESTEENITFLAFL
jgi:hypothetical protein